MSLLYQELRQLCAQFLAGERRGHTLQATALVHEVYLRLAGGTALPWNGRAHFLAVAARAARRVLTDYARTRGRQKRGGGSARVSLAVANPIVPGLDIDLLALDEALERLERLNERHARVVELRFFGGLTESEAAEVLGRTERTVRSDWDKARAWLEWQLTDRHERQPRTLRPPDAPA